MTATSQQSQQQDTGEYIKVTPSTAPLNTDNVIGFIKGLRKVGLDGWIQTLKPLNEPPTFEFLIHSDGADAPIEFLFGSSTDSHQDLLIRRLRAAYPDSFQVTRTTFSLTAAHNLTETVDTTAPDAGDSPPDPSQPFVVRWDGVGEKTRDEMTTIRRYSQRQAHTDNPDQSPLSYLIDVLANAEFPLTYQVLFQRRPNWSSAASRRKNNIRLGQDGVSDTIYQGLFDIIFGTSPEEKRDRYRGQTPTEPGEGFGAPTTDGEDIAGRTQLINAKMPARTYTVNIRALAVAHSTDQIQEINTTMNSLCTGFDHLDGYFYAVQGTQISSGIRDGVHRLTNGRIRTAAERELTHMREKRIKSSNYGKRRPHLVLNADELANFITIPNANTLTVAGARDAERNLPSQTPLPRPILETLEPFREPGMEIGYAIDENGTPEAEPLHIPPESQPRHCLLAAPTGSGKSIFALNAGISLSKNNGGPVVLIDPKGDGMCIDYMRAHLAEFGTLDNIYYFKVPQTLPAIPFYDIRPRLATTDNRDRTIAREEAVQDKVHHTHEILRMVMGRDVYDRAFANTITSYLIHALFDEEYGTDAFGLDELFDAAITMQQDRSIPPVSPDRPNDPESSLARHFAKDERQFQQSMDAVLNRLEKLKEDSFLSRIFSHVPEWDAEQNAYTENAFDFRQFLDRDVVILFDMGDLRTEAQRVLTLVFLSQVWDVIKLQKSGMIETTKIINLIIDEAAPIAASSIVANQLVPQARGFGLSLLFLVQYDQQIEHVSGNDRAYSEVLNNIHTKIIGDIAPDQALLDSLAHDELGTTELRNRINRLPNGEWLVQLTSPGYGTSKPLLFNLRPLDIPAGHPAGTNPLAAPIEQQFTTSLQEVSDRTLQTAGITVRSESETTTWGSKPPVDTESDHGSDYADSIFADTTTTTHDTTDEDGEASISDPMPASSDTDEEPPLPEEDGLDSESFTHPIPSIPVEIDQETLDKHDLTLDDIQFLKRVLDAMNGDLEDYSFQESMTTLTEGFDSLDIDHLIANDFMEESSLARRRYYTVLPAGRELLGETVAVGPGIGDLGEKTPHKAGVEILRTWLTHQDDVENAEKYFAYDEETILDAVAFDDTASITWVGEVELSSNDAASTCRDFEKLEQVDANAVWVFTTRTDMLDILDVLADAEYITRLTGRDRKSNHNIRCAIEAQNLAGMTTLRTVSELESEITR